MPAEVAAVDPMPRFVQIPANTEQLPLLELTSIRSSIFTRACFILILVCVFCIELLSIPKF